MISMLWRAAIGRLLFPVLVLGAPVHAQGACHDKFLACVASTGNPLDCFSVKNVCEGALVADAPDHQLVETVEVEQRDGNAYAYMTLVNSSISAINVGLRSRRFQCPDGSHDEAIFRFRTAIEPNDRVRGHGGVVCFGFPDAVVIESESPTLQSTASATIFCDAEQKMPIDLVLVADRTVTFRTYDDVTGRHVIEDAEGADLARMLCDQEQLAKPGIFEEIRAEMRDFLRRATDALNHDDPTKQQQMPASGSTGSRG